MNNYSSRFASAPSVWQNRLNQPAQQAPQTASGMMSIMMEGMMPSSIRAQYNQNDKMMMVDMNGIKSTQPMMFASPQQRQMPYPPTPQPLPQPRPQPRPQPLPQPQPRQPQFYNNVANLYYRQADLYSQQASLYGQLGDQFANFPPVGMGGGMTPPQPPNIGDPNGFNTFSGILGSTGFAQTLDELESQGPVTVFAPTNKAFDSLNPDILAALQRPENQQILQQVLEYHVAAKPVSFNGRPVRIDSLSQNDESILVGNAQNPYIINNQQIAMGQGAIRSQNGSITIPIDQVLLPPGVDLDALLSGGFAQQPQAMQQPQQMMAQSPSVFTMMMG